MRTRLLSICVIIAVICWFSRHFAAEDALIYARYIRNALHGDGLVFNTGEKVNALTSPLFAVLLLAVSWVMHGNVLLAGLVLCGVCLVAACAVIEQLVPWSGLFVASTSYFYYCLGMETFLFLFLLSLLTLLYVREQLDWLPLVALLTVLTRFEGLALVAAIAFQLLRERRRPAWWAYLPALVLLAVYLSCNHAEYGLWLPSSASAKIQQGRSGIWGRWPTAFLRMSYLADYFRLSLYVLPLGLIFAVIGMIKEQWSRMSRVLLPFGVGLGGFYVFFNIPHYHWYYAPFIFFIAVYAVRGLPAKRWAQVCLAVVICECVGGSIEMMKVLTSPPDYIAMGQWLEQNTRPDARIAAIETGTLGWYSNRYMDDLLGLTDPRNSLRVMHHDWTSWLPEQRPDYVVTRDPPAFGEVAAAASSDYIMLPVHFGKINVMKRKDTPR